MQELEKSLKGAADFQSFNKDQFSDYDSYLSREWDLFLENSERHQAFISATARSEIRTVLDVGCGAGQEMLPFVERGARGFGLDYVPETGQTGSRLFAEAGHQGKVQFVRGSGDHLPFEDASFDVVISRGALMFMDNNRAIAEFSRVLSPSGTLFLMFQAPAYYWWKLRTGLLDRKFRSAIHAARVLYGGSIFSVTGQQSYGKLTAGGEVYETKRYVINTCGKHQLCLEGEMPDSNPQTPFFIFRKDN